MTINYLGIAHFKLVGMKFCMVYFTHCDFLRHFSSDVAMQTRLIIETRKCNDTVASADDECALVSTQKVVMCNLSLKLVLFFSRNKLCLHIYNNTSCVNIVFY